MKIIFLCGSLEPGRDGVGDYTRRLSRNLTKDGHQISLVALNDRHIKEKFDGTQLEESVELRVLRLPSCWVDAEKIRNAKMWIDVVKPDWLSLQYVIFSFHDKGLPLVFNKYLEHLGKSHNWHIMFHELSVGLNKEASIKKKCWGFIQRIFICSLIFNLQPRVVHTQSKLYQSYLARYKPEVHYLPLFSNIPVNASPKNIPDNRAGSLTPGILIVIFGPIHKGGPVKELAREIAQYGTKIKKSIHLQLIGRSGKESVLWTELFEAEGLKVEMFGEQPASRISEVLTNASVGISTTPLALVEKSGTAAAMREHGLPVLCISDKWTAINTPERICIEGVTEYCKGVFESFMLKPKLESKTDRVNDVAKQLVTDLCNASQ